MSELGQAPVTTVPSGFAAMAALIVVAPLLAVAALISWQVAEVESDRRAATEARAAGVVADTAESDRFAEDAAVAAERSDRFRVAGGALLVTSIIVAAGAFLAWRPGRRNDATELSTGRDGLTGAGDGVHVVRRTAALLRDRRFTHHTLTIVRIGDLDLTADVYGRPQAVRDQVDVGRRIRAAVAWLVEGAEPITSSVARLDDGEFLVALHARETIDVSLLDRVLAMHSDRIVRFGRDRIPVCYRVGTHLAAHGEDVEDALLAARLAAETSRDPALDRVPSLGNPVSLERPTVVS